MQRMNGIINVLKPCGMSSQQVVSAIKRIMSIRKAGHGGTLDPAAAGVLPVFLDQATRIVEYTMDGNKEYIAQIQFGACTDTQDAHGKIMATSDKIVGYEQIQKLIDTIPGMLCQQPPAYSAIKINGLKMVDLARKGIQMEIPHRSVAIHEAELLCQINQNAYLIRILCSKGTYIRTICHDLGLQTGAYAHCSFLLRIKCGSFLLQDAFTLEQIQQSALEGKLEALILPMSTAVMNLCPVKLCGDDVRKLSFGQAVSAEGLDDTDESNQICSLWYRDTLVGIGIKDGDMIKPKKVFCGERDV